MVNINESRKKNIVSFNNIYIIFLLELEAMKGQIGKFVVNLFNPLVYLFFLVVSISTLVKTNIIYDGINISYIKYCIPGIMCIYLVNFMTHALFRTIIDKQWGILGLKMLSGISALSYIIGSTVIPYVLFLIQNILMLTVSYFVFGIAFNFTNILLFSIVSYFVITFWVNLGIIFAIIVKNYAQRDMLVNLIMLPITLTAPIFYVETQVPNFVKVLSKFNPMTYHVTLSRDLLINGDTTNLITILVITILSMVICNMLMYKTEMEKQRS